MTITIKKSEVIFTSDTESFVLDAGYIKIEDFIIWLDSLGLIPQKDDSDVLKANQALQETIGKLVDTHKQTLLQLKEQMKSDHLADLRMQVRTLYEISGLIPQKR